MGKYSVGDRVEVTITGDLTDVRTDDAGTFLAIDSDVYLCIGTPSIKSLRKVAPPKPEVGEVITGARLKATPWKRGTVIVDRANLAYLLNIDGVWADSDGVCDSFAAFDDDESLTVVYLP